MLRYRRWVFHGPPQSLQSALMSWQHPHEGDDPVIPEVVYDPQQAIGAYDGYADPATVHGWRESATEAPAAA